MSPPAPVNPEQAAVRDERGWQALTPEAAAEMAHINVRSWQETHHAIMSIAQSSSRSDADATGCQQLNVLYVLYVLASAHGIGAGVGLLDTVIEQSKAAALWVANPNPRA